MLATRSWKLDKALEPEPEAEPEPGRGLCVSDWRVAMVRHFVGERMMSGTEILWGDEEPVPALSAKCRADLESVSKSRYAQFKLASA